MRRFLNRLSLAISLMAFLAGTVLCQQVLTWQVCSDVDSAYATVTSAVTLLQSYRDRYLKPALRVRENIAFSCQHGAAPLLDFMNAQADYRSVQANYLNLIASYMDAANQLNLAVGPEAIQ